MSRISLLLTIFTATTLVQATLNNHLWLGLLQSRSPCFHSYLSVVSFQHKSQKDPIKLKSARIISTHTLQRLCPSKDKPMAYRARPLLALAHLLLPSPTCSVPTTLAVPSAQTLLPLNTHEAHYLLPEGAQMSPSQRGPLIILFKFHTPPTHC